MSSVRKMVTVRDVDSRAYRALEVLLLLPILAYGLIGLGIMIIGFGNSEAGVMGAAAALGAGYIALIVVALVSWLVTPVVLYLDAKRIKAADVEWDPNPILYAVGGFFLGYLMMMHHLYKRHQSVVDWVGRDFWWFFVAMGATLPTIFIALSLTAGPKVGEFVPFLLFGLGVLTAVPFPFGIYRDATFVRLNSSEWQPNPGNYLSLSVMLFLFAPVVFPFLGGYYLVRRQGAIGIV